MVHIRVSYREGTYQGFIEGGVPWYTSDRFHKGMVHIKVSYRDGVSYREGSHGTHQTGFIQG